MGITRIRVGHELPGAIDVLDYAIALIETYGWNQKVREGQESSDKNGFTLHDAIGAACTRLSVDVLGSKGTKDWTVTTPEGEVKNLRAEAQALVYAEVQRTVGHTDDRIFNDNAKSVDEILGVLRRAKEAAST